MNVGEDCINGEYMENIVGCGLLSLEFQAIEKVTHLFYVVSVIFITTSDNINPIDIHIRLR